MTHSARATPHFHSGARLAAERINRKIITHLSSRRALIGLGQGDRPTSGAARPVMDLVQIKGDAVPHPLEATTRPGFTVARLRVPAVLARMDEADPRRRAALAYATASERVGSIAGASGGESVDGGVTTRIRHAGIVAKVEACLLHGRTRSRA